MSTTITAQRNAVLKVYYPFSGRRFVMNWWTQGDRGHLAIAHSEAGLLELAKAIFLENWDARIDCLLEVELVTPSKVFIDEVAAQHKRDAVGTFKYMVCGTITSYMKKGIGGPPPMFKKCKTYVYAGEDHPEALDDPHDNYYAEYHVDCAHGCTDGLLLVGMTFEELYDRYHEKWAAKFDPPAYVPKKTEPQPDISLAPQVEDDTGVLAFVGDYGHHSAALHSTELNAHGWQRPVMFYYRQVRELDQAPFVKMLEESKAAKEERVRQAEAECEAANKRNVDDTFDKVAAVFM